MCRNEGIERSALAATFCSTRIFVRLTVLYRSPCCSTGHSWNIEHDVLYHQPSEPPRRPDGLSPARMFMKDAVGASHSFYYGDGYQLHQRRLFLFLECSSAARSVKLLEKYAASCLYLTYQIERCRQLSGLKAQSAAVPPDLLRAWRGTHSIASRTMHVDQQHSSSLPCHRPLNAADIV